MRISQVCIDRPVLATVMSLIIALFGLIGLTRLQNRELPNVDPPVVSVTTVPGSMQIAVPLERPSPRPQSPANR